MMLSEISSAYPIIFTIIWQSSLFITAGLIASYLCKRHPARAHQVLFLSMIAAVAVPFMTIAVKHLELGIFIAEPEPAVEYVATSEVSIQPYDNPLPDFVPSVLFEPEKLRLPWSKILLAGWVAASMIFLARLMLTFILGIRLVKKAQPFEYPKLSESIKAAASKLGMKENMVVYRSKSVSSPVIWCWKRRPILLLPPDKRLLNDKIDLVGILCHELAHLKRRDHVAGLLSEFVFVFLPWHPLLLWAKKRLLSLSEHACDDWVITAGGCGMNYAESLLDLVPAKQMAFVPAVVRNKNVMKGRVMRIVKERYGNPRLSKKWILSAVLITTCITLMVAFAQTRSARSEEEANPEYTPNPVAVSQGVPISEEADAVFEEAKQRFEANPEDLAAAREPLIEYMETQPSDSIPPEMHQMLGQFWSINKKDENHVEEANRVYATGSEMFPDNEGLLFNYVATTQELGQTEDAALLFEDCYELDENHRPYYLEHAAMAYSIDGNISEAKRVYSRLIDQAETPEELWFGKVIQISKEMGDEEEAKHYIRLAQEAGLPLQSGSETAEGTVLQLPEDLPDEDVVYDLSEVDTPPRLLRAVGPPYPFPAKRENIEGRVELRFVVDTDGSAKEPKVVESEPEGVFEEPTMKAITQYKFVPAILDGIRVACIYKMRVNFKLD